MSSKWQSLFSGNGYSSIIWNFRVVAKGGHPFLFLPGQASAAQVTLSLYPAQSRLARVFKLALSTGLRLSLPLLLPRLAVSIDPCAPFVQFLSRLAGSTGVPLWGMLAGNPGAPGRRFVFLIFGDDGTPRAIVKAGTGDAAEALIAREAEMLRALPPGLLGACPLLCLWEGEGTKALALPFVAGEPPLPQETPTLLAPLLMDWLAHGSLQSLGSLPGWRALAESGWTARLQPLLPEAAENVVVQSPVMHGDLAPWNIKSASGKWTVIDWERGTLCGVPAWDWFHYVLQPGVLVQKWDGQTVADEATRLLESKPFRQYAKAAQIEGLERALLLGYLVHCTEVIRQGEGSETLVSAREILSRAWGAAD